MSYQREYERKIRVGLVGVGSHAYRNLLPTFNFLPVKLEALCSRGADRMAWTAAQYGVDKIYTSAKEMYEKADIEAVFICTSPFFHAELVIQALDAGLHVWLEKPPAVSVDEVRRMMEHQGDRVVTVGFKKAFMPAMQKVRELVGPPENLKTLTAEYPVSVPSNYEEIMSKGIQTPWLDNGSHPISAMVSVGGDVTAVTTHRSGKGGGVCVLEFATGAIGSLILADGMKGPCERYVFYTEDTHITVDNASKVSHHRGIPHGYDSSVTFAPEGTDHGTQVWEPRFTFATLENKGLFIQGFFNQMKAFCDAVLGENVPREGSLETALQVMGVYEAAMKSRGDRVPLAL